MSLDIIRIFTVILGGISVGIAIPVVRVAIARARRFDALAARLIFLAHVSIVTYIAGVMAERAGDPLSWYTPAAIFVFMVKIAAVLNLREALWERECELSPPARRAADRPA